MVDVYLIKLDINLRKQQGDEAMVQYMVEQLMVMT